MYIGWSFAGSAEGGRAAAGMLSSMMRARTSHENANFVYTCSYTIRDEMCMHVICDMIHSAHVSQLRGMTREVSRGSSSGPGAAPARPRSPRHQRRRLRRDAGRTPDSRGESPHDEGFPVKEFGGPPLCPGEPRPGNIRIGSGRTPRFPDSYCANRACVLDGALWILDSTPFSRVRCTCSPTRPRG